MLLIWPHCPFQDLPFAYKYCCSQPLWFKIPWFLSNQISIQSILQLTLHLLLHLFLPPLLPLRLVKVVMLVTGWLRRRRKGRRRRRKGRRRSRRRRKFSKGATMLHLVNIQNPHIKAPKPKFPCIICRGDHFHRDCPFFPWILREWPPNSHQPVPSTSGDHVGNIPSNSDSEVNGHKTKVKVPCRLCEGNHSLHHCPFLHEAKRVLDNHPASLQRLPPS